MTQFVAKDPNVFVHFSSVLASVNTLGSSFDICNEILKANNIELYKSDWILQQNWLNALRTIALRFGETSLFLIGNAIIDNFRFPYIENLEAGLRFIDIAYHLSHRLDGKIMIDISNGDIIDGIGNYKLISYNENESSARIVCNTPYPSMLDKGVITEVVRKFKPIGTREDVMLDLSNETRLRGGDSCCYDILW